MAEGFPGGHIQEDPFPARCVLTLEPPPPRAYTPEEGQARLEAYRRRLAERERLKADRLS